jgi:putative flippase GtrA
MSLNTASAPTESSPPAARPTDRWRELVSALLVERTDSVWVQFFRYGIVGGIAFVVDFGTLWAFTHFVGLHYLLSALVGFVAGLTTNYLLSINFVFSQRKLTSRSREFGLFALVGVIGVGINELVMWLFTDGLGTHYLISKVIATVIVYLWNFTARKKLMF